MTCEAPLYYRPMLCNVERTSRGTNLGINTALFRVQRSTFNVQHCTDLNTDLFDHTSHDSGAALSRTCHTPMTVSWAQWAPQPTPQPLTQTTVRRNHCRKLLLDPGLESRFNPRLHRCFHPHRRLCFRRAVPLGLDELCTNIYSKYHCVLH
jgi:hypothetical protein